MSEEVELGVADALERRDLHVAARCVVEGYGSEIFAFLCARTGNQADACEAYSMFLENLWRGLPGYEGRATARVWAYTIARHAALRVRRTPSRRRERNVPLSEADADACAAPIRTETPAYLQTANRGRVAVLCEQLAPDDRDLLVLRVNRDLGWNDVARIFLSEESATDDAMLEREAARLRKRFQLVKRRLRQLGP